ncbi:MAG: slipin family protein [Acidobacteriaceae bacterium]|nr:slipin family protein [Acidobacteriaceae bacterium]
MFPITPFVLLVLALYLISSIKILAEYERAVVFRLGRVLSRPKGPGLVLIFRPIDRMARISLRLTTLEVPPQDVVTRDNVTIKVNAVVFLRVLDPMRAVLEVAEYLYTTSQLAQTSLRSVLGQVDLDEVLSERDKLNIRLQSLLDQDTEPWGVKVTKVEVKQVDLPDQMIRAIARQAEAERERRAKIIHAEGEYLAAEKLAMAAELIQRQPVAIQLRYLQTLVEIGAEKNTTVVFPLPIDIFSAISKAFENLRPAETLVRGSESRSAGEPQHERDA